MALPLPAAIAADATSPNHATEKIRRIESSPGVYSMRSEGREKPMTNRRQFLKEAAAAGVLFTGCGLRAQNGSAGRRRQVSVGGRRVKTIDIHAHVVIPEATELMGVKTASDNASVMDPKRFATMDEWGTD